MTDDTTPDTTAAPVGQAPAQASPAADPGLVAALREAFPLLVDQFAAPPVPAPAAAPVDEPQDAVPADAAPDAAAFKAGSIALYEHEHFGTTKYQIMLVVGVYDYTDPDTKQVTHRLRMLPLGTAQQTADLPVDQVVSAAAFDWEAAA